MYNNGRWNRPKVVLYCQVGTVLDMLDYSITSAVKHAGMPAADYDIVFICWNTSDEVYEYLKAHRYKWVDMEYEPKRGFLHNLYGGWNLGYEVGYEHADYVCPIATDHAFHENWLSNLYRHAKPNRIVSCNLIESGTCPTIHPTADLGLPVRGGFAEDRFNRMCRDMEKDELVVRPDKYGWMPFVCPKDVWRRFGPMAKTLTGGVTGDVDFFDRCAAGGVELAKALGSISYHYGAAEAKRNGHVRAEHAARARLRNLKRRLSELGKPGSGE